MHKKLLLLFFILLGFAGQAQVEMADNFRSEGKIYVVIAIILIILIGFFAMLIKLDRKTKRLEKTLEEQS